MLKGYRTVLFNLIMGVAALAVTLGYVEVAPSGDDVNVFLDHLDAVLSAVWLVGNLILRRMTTTPIGKAE